MSAKAPAPHTHGPDGRCETCGHAMKTEIECGYEVNDRQMQALLVAARAQAERGMELECLDGLRKAQRIEEYLNQH